MSTVSVRVDTTATAVSAYPQDYWSDARLGLKQKIWGPGFVEPGGEAFVIDLVQPCGLTSVKSLLDITAGLGGAARALANKFDVWVTGIEREPILAEQAMVESERLGYAKKAPVGAYDPAEIAINKTFDVVFAREAFFTLPEKPAFFDKVASALKPYGELVFTDFVRTSQPPTPAYEAWLATEPVAPQPWTLDEYVSELTQMGMDVRVQADISEDYALMARRELHQFVTANQLTDYPRDHLLLLVDEVELWGRRIAAFEAGDLAFVRIFAIKLG